MKIKRGDKIYVPSSYHVYRGQDDFSGGLATIDKIEYNEDLPSAHFNYVMVGIAEHPGTMYNWKHLASKQQELKLRYEGMNARPDPDNDPEFNKPNADWR